MMDRASGRFEPSGGFVPSRNDLSPQLAGVLYDRRAALRAGFVAMEVLGAVALLGGAAGCAPTGKSSAAFGALAGVLLGLVIPDGETPGAGNQGNLEFVLCAVDAGLMGTPQDTLAKLAAELDGQVPGWKGFMDQPYARQAAILAAYDRQVFAAPITFPNPWFTTKALMLMAYYTSKSGASEQLTYELAPGRYDRDVAVTPAFKLLSNDYSANSIKKKIAGT
jgi:hypothetical protein